MTGDLLDLVRQYGDARCLMGIGRDYAANTEEAQALFARIAALVPQQPVQARSGLGFPWFHHGCGEVAKGSVPPRLHTCDKPGPWRQLLVADPDGDRTPEADVQRLDEQRAWLHRELLAITAQRDEFAAERDTIRRLHETQASNFVAATDRLIAQRDEARAELAAAEVRENTLRESLQGARAEVKDLTARVDHLRNWRTEHDKRERERDEALAEIERLKTAAPVHDGVLRLPEVPEGTVAAVGLTTHDRYVTKIDDQRYYDRRPTFESSDGSWWGDLGELLSREPHGVRVEVTRPREQRTAAEIWAGMHNAEREEHIRKDFPALAEALDREAGL